MTLAKSKIRALLILVAFLGFSAKANAVNLVVSGDFSSMNGWTLTGNYKADAPTGPNFSLGAAPTAQGFIFLNASPNAYLSQVVPTIAGNSYVFSYSLINAGGYDPLYPVVSQNYFSASLNGVPTQTLVNAPAFPLEVLTSTFTATGSTALQFAAFQNSSAFLVGNVSITQVPLPSSFPLFAVGLLGLGWVAAKRARNAG